RADGPGRPGRRRQAGGIALPLRDDRRAGCLHGLHDPDLLAGEHAGGRPGRLQVRRLRARRGAPFSVLVLVVSVILVPWLLPPYYAREGRRVAGKPKIVWQKYLGKADDIVAALSQPQAPSVVSAVVAEFGAVAALFDLAQRLRLVEHIDRHVPAGRGPAGP